MFGLNAPVTGDPSMGTAPPVPGGAGIGLNMTQPVTGGGAKAPPGVTPPGNNMQPVTAPQAPPATSPSPLASPLAAGSFGQPQNQTDNPAPAAGVGSQFSGKAGF
jgi:hypothetical protein